MTINPIIEGWLTENLPSWSLPAIINGDESGLNESEIAMIAEWESFWTTGNRQLTVSVPMDVEASFCTSPAFGLPCDCIPCVIHTRKL